MAVEIEAKMRLEDFTEIEKTLAQQGAVHVRTIIEYNTYFDSSSGELKSSDQGLRVREETEVDGDHREVIITYKGPRAHGKLKSRSETEAHVANVQEAHDLLIALGFHPVMSFEKKRQIWTLDECTIALDLLPHLGHFIEVEGTTDEAVLSVNEKLGLGSAPMIRASYVAMLHTWLVENQVHSTDIRLVNNDEAVTSR